MRFRLVVVAAALLAPVVLVPAVGHGASRATETIKVLPDLNGTGVKTTKTRFGYKQRYKFVITGSVEERGDDDVFTKSESRTYDAFYCFAGPCAGETKITGIRSGGLGYGFDLRRGVIYVLSDLLRRNNSQSAKYNPQHRYEFVYECLDQTGCGHMVLRAHPRGFQELGSSYIGLFTVQITPLGEFDEGPTDKLVVRFIARASGKPNVPLKGYPSSRTLVRSSVDGSGEATFTKKNANVLVATSTKGSITHTDTYADGTTERLVFGIVSGTRYVPDLHRLALVLRLKESTDPDCKPGFLVGEKFGTLTLLPEADTGGGTAIFFGVPETKLTGACKHAHGWTASPSEHVSARILVRESTP